MNFEEWFKDRHQKTGLYEKCQSGDDDATYLKHEMRKSWEISAKQQAKPSHCVTLTCAQLREALNFGAPDNDDQEQLETEMTIVWSEVGHSGKGYYCYYSELPEEGAIFLDEVTEAQESTNKEQP